VSDERRVEVSVVIVAFNNEHEIRLCLESVISELKKFSFQIFIIDNHSRDRTRNQISEFCSMLANQNGEVELIFNPNNIGFTAALNQGLKRSRSDDILILNADTMLKSGSLVTLKTTLQSQKQIGVVAPQLLNPDGTIQPSCRRFPRYRDVLFEITRLSYLFKKSRIFNAWKMGDFDHRSRRRVDQPQGACLLFRRQLLEEVGLWDERFPMFFSDVDWCQRVKSQEYEIVFEPAAQVIHHKGVSVLQQRLRMIWSSHRSFYKYFKKHYYQPKFFLLNAILGAILFFAAILRIAWASLANRQS
jgi:hypothetical protein